MAKDVVYIDIDDEITSVINKVQSSSDKVVALVLPKQATTFHSSINMKLLKKAAGAAKKSLVLITSDTSVLPLAGAARLHVAKTLQSKPVLPPAPHEATEASVITDEELAAVAAEPAVPAEAAAGAEALADEVIELDNTDKAPKKDTAAAPEAPKNKKLRVPNFSSFRLKIFLAAFALVLVIVGYVFGFLIMPRAKIAIKTDASTSPVSFQFTMNAAAKEVNKETNVVPAALVEVKKTDSEKVAATGKQDQGTKAAGTMTIYNCTDNDVVVPAGTVFTNTGYSFSLDEDTTVPASDFYSAANGGACKKNRSKTGNVTATQPGGNSNLSAGREYSSNFAYTVTGLGGAMGGGTSNMVTVVSQDDINNAQAKLTGRQRSAAQGELRAQLANQSKEALDETLSESTPAFTPSAAVGQQVADVTVTAVTTYKMLGVAKDDLAVLVEAAINKTITNNHQKILNNGIEGRQLTIVNKKSETEQVLSVSVSATIGPDLDPAAIARDAAGKKRGDITASLNGREGVKEVVVTYSPFWITQTPKKAAKINVVIDQPNAK